MTMAITGFWFGGIVDHHKKKSVMIGSGIATLISYILSLSLYFYADPTLFKTVASPTLWIFLFLVLSGVIAGNIRGITLPTLTTILVNEKDRDKANGMSGTVMGISFALASVFSGLVLASYGIAGVLIIGIIITIIALIHLHFMDIKEKGIVHTAEKPKQLDIPGTMKIVKAIPGLFGLIMFTTFNNFLGGVFMALMDAYGLSLVPLKVWGTLWGFLSLGFIVGGLYIAKYGLGKNPLKTLLYVNIILWIDCIFFTIQPSIVLLSAGMLLYVCLVPFVEAIEHTIIQKVVAPERQGRVFGVAQSIESAASPISSFAIGPIAQLVFIPFMTTGAGVELIGDWYGVGQGRGLALVFSLAGIIGLIITIFALRSKAYKLLSKHYENEPAKS